MKMKIVAFMLVALLANQVYAASRDESAPALIAMSLKSEDEAVLMTDRVMKAVARGELDAAYGALNNYAVLPASEIDVGLQASKQQRAAPGFADRFGATIGYELLGKRKVGESMMRVRYIEKTEKLPLPWTFDFYLTPQGWVLSEFGWNAQPGSLYDSDSK